jgi:hypothetical protein
MRHIIITLSLVAVSAFCRADDKPIWHGQLLLTDGVSIIPNAKVPTPAEVAAVASSASATLLQASAAASAAEELKADAQELDIQAAALDGAAIVYGSCVAFGAETVDVPDDVSATIVHISFPSNGTSYAHIYVHYSDVMDEVWPMVAETPTGTWSKKTPLESVFDTWNIGGEQVDAYRMLIDTGDENTLFFRASGDVRKSVVGQLNVMSGLTINGRPGVTTTNSLGVFYNGMLVEPLVLAQDEGGDTQ